MNQTSHGTGTQCLVLESRIADEDGWSHVLTAAISGMLHELPRGDQQFRVRSEANHPGISITGHFGRSSIEIAKIR